MAYSVSTAKSELAGILHGTTINQVTNIDGVFYRAARQLLLDIDPQETKRITQFTNPIFNQVYNYAVPSDLKGNRIIDIRPQTPRTPQDVYLQIYNQYFDRIKAYALQGNFTIQFNNFSKTIRIDAPQLPPGTTIDDGSSITNNGTWAATSSASNLTVDEINYVAGGGSLQFDLAAAGSTGYIENSTLTAVDLSDYTSQGTLFAWVYFPTASVFTNVILRWGNDTSNYWSLTATTQADGTAFQNGWNLLSFSWASATQTGTVDETAIDYLRVTYTYDGTAQTGVQFNGVVCRLGTILEIEYYSKYLFRDSSTGAFQETITADTNYINLDTESLNLLLNVVAHFCAQQQQGKNALQFDATFYGQQYLRGLARYQKLYPSETQKPTTVYYSMPRPSNTTKVRRNY